MDNNKLFKMGYKPITSLRDGIKKTYSWYIENKQKFV
jgi:nucleoside-diphosphate-sugar epimerase